MLEEKESDIQRGVLDYLRIRGHFAFRVNTQGVPIHRPGEVGRFRPSPMKGVADIVGVQRGTGRFFALEIKTRTGRVSDEQEAFLANVERAGGLAAVIRSVDEVRPLGL